MITIDGQEIYATWTLDPLYDGFYNVLMQGPELKDRITNDFTDEDGMEVLLTPGKVKAKELTLQFSIGSYDKYVEFLTYVSTHTPFVLYSDYLDESIKMRYTGCTALNHGTFSLKALEINPRDR